MHVLFAKHPERSRRMLFKKKAGQYDCSLGHRLGKVLNHRPQAEQVPVVDKRAGGVSTVRMRMAKVNHVHTGDLLAAGT
jgi:hypothetical protein